MKILVMGGTGVIGQELIPQLALDVDNELVVTSRRQRVSQDRVNYIRGNAKEISFIKPLIEGGDFDVIIDFMLYSVGEFEARFELMMKSCRQYIFLVHQEYMLRQKNRLMKHRIDC